MAPLGFKVIRPEDRWPNFTPFPFSLFMWHDVKPHTYIGI